MKTLSRPLKIICHGRNTINLALKHGWLPGAKYTNLRDIKGLKTIGLIDIDWKNYSFEKHLLAVRKYVPILTVAQDIENAKHLPKILEMAAELKKYVKHVIIVPKDPKLASNLTQIIPKQYLLGYSVPTVYGATSIPINAFKNRKVHLLGGRPDTQYRLSHQLNVFSFDTNRITLDAKYGDYFNGTGFSPHPNGGLEACIQTSFINIEKLWNGKHCLMNEYFIRKGMQHDLPSIKDLTDAHRKEFGFVIKSAIAESIRCHEVLVARHAVSRSLIGFCRFHLRRDGVIKVYEICVSSMWRRVGIARHILNELRQLGIEQNAQKIALLCPVDLEANHVYFKLGFRPVDVREGKSRRLKLWISKINPVS